MKGWKSIRKIEAHLVTLVKDTMRIKGNVRRNSILDVQLSKPFSRRPNPNKSCRRRNGQGSKRLYSQPGSSPARYRRKPRLTGRKTNAMTSFEFLGEGHLVVVRRLIARIGSTRFPLHDESARGCHVIAYEKPVLQQRLVPWSSLPSGGCLLFSSRMMANEYTIFGTK